MPNPPNARKARSTPDFAKPPAGPPRSPVPARPAPKGGVSSRVWITVAVVAVLAIVAGVIAITSSDDSSTPSTQSVPAGVEQTRPVTVTGTALAPQPGSGADPAVGATAPALTGAGFDGSPVTVAADGTDATLVLFLAHWCSHCQREVPRLVDWAAADRVPAGVDVVGIATQTADDQPNYPPSAWLREAEFPWPVMADSASGDAADAFGMSSWPGFVLLDEDGTVLWRASGEIDMDELTTIITEALAAP